MNDQASHPESSPSPRSPEPDLITRARNGDDLAIQQLCSNHFEALTRIARNRLQRELLRYVDAEDIVQSAMRQFFKKDSRFEDIGDAQHFWRLLVKMTIQKVIDYHRKHFAGRRGGGQVRGDSVFMTKDQLAGGFGIVESSDTPPEFETTVDDQLQHMLSVLNAQDSDGKKRYGSIVLFKMQDYSNEQIAAEMQCSSKTIERRLKEIEEIWAREAARENA